MEFSAGGRLEVRVTPTDVGKRVSVRQLTGAGPGAGQFTDTVGVLTSWDDGVVLVTRRTGERVSIPESALVAAKVVPAAPARRRGPAASFDELAHVCARAWQPAETERLGDWRLGASGGFTRRANSVVPLGGPGLPLDEALERVRAWYGARGLPPYIQVSSGAEGTQELLGAELARRGWVAEVSVEVRIGALAPLAEAVPDADAERVVLRPVCDESWLRGYHRFSAPGPEVLHVLNTAPSVRFATVPGATETPAAIGRCVVDGRWAGFMAVEVDPAHRRQGLATAVMTALARDALTQGASAAWLQVETENEAARAMYDRLGFVTHHRYQHFRFS